MRNVSCLTIYFHKKNTEYFHNFRLWINTHTALKLNELRSFSEKNNPSQNKNKKTPMLLKQRLSTYCFFRIPLIPFHPIQFCNFIITVIVFKWMFVFCSRLNVKFSFGDVGWIFFTLVSCTGKSKFSVYTLNIRVLLSRMVCFYFGCSVILFSDSILISFPT